MPCELLIFDLSEDEPFNAFALPLSLLVMKQESYKLYSLSLDAWHVLFVFHHNIHDLNHFKMIIVHC